MTRPCSGFGALFSLIFVNIAAGQQPCSSTLTGHVDVLPLASKVFNNQRSLRVWLPPDYSAAANAQRKYKVLYILDGLRAFDICSHPSRVESRADEALTELIGSGRLEPIIAVAIDEGSPAAQRAREYVPYPDAVLPFVRGDAYVSDVMGGRFPEFLEKDVFPVVAAKYRILTGRDNTAIQGSSYGAVAALYALTHRPDLFGSGIVQSPSLQVGNGQLLRDTKALVTGPRRLWLDVGSVSDVPAWTVEALAENLRAIRMSSWMNKVPEIRFLVGEGHSHQTADFAKRLPAALEFLYQR